jgi:hypothetical protein
MMLNSEFHPMAREPMIWLKFQVTASEHEELRKACATARERWFGRWCRKLLLKAVKPEEPKP